MPAVISWSSIELLHNVVRTFDILKAQDGTSPPVIGYRSKVKLHGTNCAVQILNGALQCQGRTALLEPSADYKGFAAWVHGQQAWFRSLSPGMVVYGEWCGPGVEKGMAVSALPHKLFAVFGIQRGLGPEARLVVDPVEIEALLPAQGRPAELHVLPWEEDELVLDYGSREDLERAARALEERVARVEAEDPWVKRTFGVSGLGEGLVMYPVSSPQGVPSEPEAYARWMFKAKGEKHRTVATARAVALDPAAASSASDFAALVVTEARLQQGLQIVCDGARDPRKTGAFLGWVLADVRKECGAELSASGLTWDKVERAITARAREWFLKR